MDLLTDWIGKVDDLSLAYEAGIIRSPELPEGVCLDDNLPAISIPPCDNIRELTCSTWDNNVPKADRIDYLLAIASGTIAGLIDIFYVGDFSLERANKWGKEETARFVRKVAELQGFKGEDLSDAIKSLEKEYRFAADSVTQEFGGGLQHHLRDFSHHFSLGGVICSLYTQFTGKVIGADTSGQLLIVELEDTTLIGKDFEEKILFGTIKWFFHMVSDMAGSSTSPGKGTGIPGPLVSLIKDVSMLPAFREKKIGEHDFYVWVSKLFNGTLLAKRDENGKIIEPLRFDLRTEIGTLHELGRQFIPVLINECIVRSMYFVRRLFKAIKEAEVHTIGDLKKIDTSDLLPFNNRIIKRMVTVASGTFTALDTVDAMVWALIKSKGVGPGFLADFAVRLNFVGVGRFIIACREEGKIFAEDLRSVKAQRRESIEKYEKYIADVKCFTLELEQLRVLNSIEKKIIEDDIASTKVRAERELKTQWKNEWESSILNELRLVSSTAGSYFLSEDDIIHYFETSEDVAQFYLLAIEAMTFRPYYPVDGTNCDRKELKKLKCKSKYLTHDFAVRQSKMSKTDFDILTKAYKKAKRTITGSTKRILYGGAGTTLTSVLLGLIALKFAPVIAVYLVGKSGLYGAALVSYSLAAIGGGALAVGGLGMAGGTAIIAGGGALIGLLGGTGVSAASTVSLLAEDGFVLNECCKLVTFAEKVLLEKNHDVSTVVELQSSIEIRIKEVESQIDTFANVIEKEIESKDKKQDLKRKIKVAKKSLRFLSQTVNALEKMIDDQKSTAFLQTEESERSD